MRLSQTTKNHLSMLLKNIVESYSSVLLGSVLSHSCLITHGVLRDSASNTLPYAITSCSALSSELVPIGFDGSKQNRRGGVLGCDARMRWHAAMVVFAQFVRPLCLPVVLALTFFMIECLQECTAV